MKTSIPVEALDCIKAMAKDNNISTTDSIILLNSPRLIEDESI